MSERTRRSMQGYLVGPLVVNAFEDINLALKKMYQAK